MRNGTIQVIVMALTGPGRRFLELAFEFANLEIFISLLFNDTPSIADLYLSIKDDEKMQWLMPILGVYGSRSHRTKMLGSHCNRF